MENETITSTELKLRLGKYLIQASHEPVVITIRGEETHVLMALREYEKMKRELEASRKGVGAPEQD